MRASRAMSSSRSLKAGLNYARHHASGRRLRWLIVLVVRALGEMSSPRSLEAARFHYLRATSRSSDAATLTYCVYLCAHWMGCLPPAPSKHHQYLAPQGTASVTSGKQCRAFDLASHCSLLSYASRSDSSSGPWSCQPASCFTESTRQYPDKSF